MTCSDGVKPIQLSPSTTSTTTGHGQFQLEWWRTWEETHTKESDMYICSAAWSSALLEFVALQIPRGWKQDDRRTDGMNHGF